MKEQVSVDIKIPFSEDKAEFEKKYNDLLKQAVASSLITDDQIIITKEEHARLKRLDENIKEEIERLKSLTHWPSMSNNIIKLLERFYE